LFIQLTVKIESKKKGIRNWAAMAFPRNLNLIAVRPKHHLFTLSFDCVFFTLSLAYFHDVNWIHNFVQCNKFLAMLYVLTFLPVYGKGIWLLGWIFRLNN
jgi:prophage maintenance system killer protein